MAGDVPMSFHAQVWQTLSRIDCSKHVEKKMNLSYLSWAWAWAILMEEYPESSFEFEPPVDYPDGTQEVWVNVTVRAGDSALTRRMWLPVLDHQNRPIKSPNSFQVNTTRMRCLTKCLAMFGLGHHIYAGEDVPRPELDAPAVGEKRDNRATTAALDGVQFTPSQEKLMKEYVSSIQAAVFNEDEPGLLELVNELGEDADMKIAVWRKLNSKERSYIKKLSKVAA